MLSLAHRADGRPPSLALFGAHCDDLEIGTGATLLQLARAHPGLRVEATVLTSTPDRAAESRAALTAFLPGADLSLTIHELRDGRLPAHWDETKTLMHEARERLPDAGLVLAPARHDAHQDHRLLGELVGTVYRDNPVLHYEILKWDGDLGRPNVYVPAERDLADLKWTLLHEHFVSQRQRGWFDRDALLGLMRVRGVECNARYAEAFVATKLVLDTDPGGTRP